MTYGGQMKLVSTCEVDLDVLKIPARALLIIEYGNSGQLGTTDIVKLGDNGKGEAFFKPPIGFAVSTDMPPRGLSSPINATLPLSPRTL